MRIPARPLRSALAALIVLAATAPAVRSQDFTFSGTFFRDDQVAFRDFSLLSSGTFVFRTTSAAAGGFDPILSLFSAGGALLGADDDDDFGEGGLPAGSLDAYLRLDLLPGDYRLAVSQSPNFFDANTGQFFLAGQGNFTGGPFLDAAGVQRSGSFVVIAQEIPEPGTAALAVSCLPPLMGIALRRRRTNRRA